MNENIEQNEDNSELTLKEKLFYKILPAVYIHELYTYYDFNSYEVGQFCIINFHGKNTVGIIWEIVSSDQINELLSKKNIVFKKIESLLSHIKKLSPEYLKLIEKIAYFHLESPGLVLKNMISVICSSYQKINKEKIDKILKKNNQISINIQNSAILNEFQLQAYSEYNLHSSDKNLFLIEGETGSGKTEVYLEIIKDVINQSNDSQVLILLPEVALTNAIIDRIKLRFSNKIEPICFHHDITNSKRIESFILSGYGNSRIFVGARSAIFLPFKNLKLIIVDEEHDQSFKQDQGGIIYHLMDIVFFRSQFENIKVILSSATPSLETIFLIKQKKIHRIFLNSIKKLESRMNIKIIDMKERTEDQYQIISNDVIENIQKNLNLGLQSMVFLNRRGYNHMIICNNCKNKLLCKNCSISLVYYKEIGKLYCHYCGLSNDIKNILCNICKDQSRNFKFFGFGIEKIHEIIKNHFSKAKIALLSSDSMSSKNIDDVISKIENSEIDIIIGTQILAKGHNFPNLKFLAVLDGGLNFSGIDLRSSERTYQILHQILGRIGRFDFSGDVIIQTNEPKSKILMALKSFNKTAFYISELNQRKEFNMPPFSTLIKINFSGLFKESVSIEANKFCDLIERTEHVNILGPSPSAIFKLNKKYRYNVFLQSDKKFDLHGFLLKNLKKISFNKKIIVKIDVNPMNFI